MRWCWALLALLACAATVPNPSAADLQRGAAIYPALTLADLEAGRSLYLRRCTSCHRAMPPNERSADGWQKEVGEMRKRANLTADDERLLVSYLVTMAKP